MCCVRISKNTVPNCRKLEENTIYHSTQYQPIKKIIGNNYVLNFSELKFCLTFYTSDRYNNIQYNLCMPRIISVLLTVK